MNENYFIRKRIFNIFPSIENGIKNNYNWNKYLDWNQKDLKRKRKYLIQLYRVLNHISNFIKSLKIKEIDYIIMTPWIKNNINIEINNFQKNEIILIHKAKLKSIFK